MEVVGMPNSTFNVSGTPDSSDIIIWQPALVNIFLSRSSTLFDNIFHSVNISSFIASICCFDPLTLQVAAFGFSRAGLAEVEIWR